MSLLHIIACVLLPTVYGIGVDDYLALLTSMPQFRLNARKKNGRAWTRFGKGGTGDSNNYLSLKRVLTSFADIIYETLLASNVERFLLQGIATGCLDGTFKEMTEAYLQDTDIAAFLSLQEREI